MDCKTLTNANAGGIETYGFTSGLLFAGKNPGGMAVSAAKTKEAWENLMLLNTFNRTGKELKLKLPEIAEKKIEPFNRTGKELKPSIVFL